MVNTKGFAGRGRLLLKRLRERVAADGGTDCGPHDDVHAEDVAEVIPDDFQAGDDARAQKAAVALGGSAYGSGLRREERGVRVVCPDKGVARTDRYVANDSTGVRR